MNCTRGAGARKNTGLEKSPGDLWRRLTALGLMLLTIASAIPAAIARPKVGVLDHDRSTGYYRYQAVEREKARKARKGKVLLKGHVNYCVPKGTPIKLKLSAVPSTGMSLMDRDFEGNLHPAKLGQRITAKTTEDIYVDSNKVIPEGTTFYGRVSKIHPPRRVRRPGHLEISFDKLKLPDGKVFAFKLEADNFKKSTARTKARGFGIIAAHAAGGAIVGALVAYKLAGMSATIEMYGMNLGAGAAAGALIATGFAVMKKGPRAVLEPGDDLNMRFDQDLLMPIAQEPKVYTPPPSLEGLNITVQKLKKVKDGLGKKVLKLDILVDNNTKRYLHSIDLFLEDTNGNRNALSSAGDSESELMFRIPPHSLVNKHLHFSLEWPKLGHSLIWLDHHTRQPIHTLRLF